MSDWSIIESSVLREIDNLCSEALNGNGIIDTHDIIHEIKELIRTHGYQCNVKPGGAE